MCIHIYTLMCRRDLPHFHTRHRPLHQTQGRWAPTQIEGPLFELGKLGPGCNDRASRAAGQAAIRRQEQVKRALHPLPARFTRLTPPCCHTWDVRKS